jgi:uncharacterized protein (TIGR03545 family)
VQAFDFATIKHLDTLEQRADAIVRQWESVRQDFRIATGKLAEVETDLKSVKPQELKTPESIALAVQRVDRSLKTVNEVQQSVSSRRDAVSAELQSIESAVGAIDDLAAADLRKVQSMARLPQLKTGGIAETLLGPALMRDVTKAMYWVDFARTNVKRYSPEPEIEKPPRLEGQTIHYPAERAYPKFWVRNIQVSGGTDSTQDPDHIRVIGRIRNISSDQRVTGEPMTVDLQGRRGRAQQLKFSALFDRRKDEALDSYEADLRGIRLADMAIGSPTFLPASITGAGLSTTVSLTIPASRFDGTVGLQFRSMDIRFAGEPRSTVERLAREVLDGINGFDASLRLWNTDGGLALALQTDLDDRLFDRVKGVLGAELAQLQAELKEKVDDKIAERRHEFETLYAAKRKQIEEQLAAYQAGIESNLAGIESKKKELEQRLEHLKKGAVDDALKKLLKR